MAKTRRRTLEPLKVKCTSTDCENELHCFRTSKKMEEAERGNCRSCGEAVVDWNRVRSRNSEDKTYTFKALKTEYIRHHYWTKEIDIKARNHARRKGRTKLEEAIVNRLKKSIGPKNPAYDGRQTPTSNNIIYYAQHALACCCRTCLEYWHGIPKSEALTDEEVDYFVELVMDYVDQRMPDLTEVGEKVPYIRNAR